MSGRASTEPDQITYTIRVEREVLDALRRIAEAEERSLAGHLRTMFKREIAEREDDWDGTDRRAA